MKQLGTGADDELEDSFHAWLNHDWIIQQCSIFRLHQTQQINSIVEIFFSPLYDFLEMFKGCDFEI